MNTLILFTISPTFPISPPAPLSIYPQSQADFISPSLFAWERGLYKRQSAWFMRGEALYPSLEETLL